MTIESRGDVKTAICEYFAHAVAGLQVTNPPCDVMHDARTGTARSMVRVAKEIDGDRMLGRAVKEPENGPVISCWFEPQRVREKPRCVLETLDLDFDGSDSPYHGAL